jgi:hypothetical protein
MYNFYGLEHTFAKHHRQGIFMLRIDLNVQLFQTVATR